MGAMATSRPLKTLDDYMALGDEVRAELIAGELYVTPSPTADHQTISGNLHALLRAAARETHAGIAYAAPLDVHLPSGDVVQPDLLWIREANRSIVRDWVRGVPDLVVEIVSPHHAERDRIVKRELYARNGVPEYWIVDGATRTLERLVLAGDLYAAAGYFHAVDDVASDRVPGLRFRVATLFEDLGALPDSRSSQA